MMMKFDCDWLKKVAFKENMFWGLLDISFFITFIINSISMSKIPFYGDIISSIETANLYGSSLPIILGSASTLFILSTVVSGLFLLKNLKPVVKLLMVQFPFRLFLFYPSIFFIVYLLPQNSDNVYIIFIYGFSVLVEIYKIKTVSYVLTKNQ